MSNMYIKNVYSGKPDADCKILKYVTLKRESSWNIQQKLAKNNGESQNKMKCQGKR